MTRLCNCPKSLASKLELHSRKQQVIEESCKTCGGRYLVDGIGPIATRMLSTVNPEATNSINPELNWKTVTKGRRSRNSVARNVNRPARLGKRSPKRIGDFSVVDSDKNEESVTGHQNLDKVGNVPLKKRRHLLQSTSPPPPSSHHENSLLPQPETPSPIADEFCSDSTRQELMAAVKPRDKVDDNNISEETDSKLHHPDFSGIKLLAVVACTGGTNDETTSVKMDPGVGEVSVPERSHPSTSPSNIRYNTFVESENFVQKDVVKEESAECSPPHHSVALSRSSHEDGGAMDCSVASKVHRLHWDLNIPMDDWEQPLDDPVEWASSKDVSDHGVKGESLEREDYETLRNFEDNQCGTENHMPLGQTEQTKFELAQSPGRACKEIGSMSLDEHPVKSLKDLYTNDESGNQVVSKMPSNLSLAWAESHQVPVVSVNEDKIGTPTGSMSINVKDEMGSIGLPGVLASESSVCEVRISGVAEVPRKTFELPDDCGSNLFETDHSHSSPKCEEMSASGASTYSVVCSPKGQPDTVSVADTVTLALDHAVSKVPTPNYDDHYASDEVENVSAIRVDSNKKDDRPHSEDLSNASAKTESTLEDCHNLDVSQVDLSNTVGSKDITEVHAGYDSPYEDGELRVSMSSPWEENGIEDGDELVDYESDGREVVDFDDADYLDSEVVETGFQGSKGTEKRSVGVREVSALDCSKSESLRSSLRTDYMKEDIEKIENRGNKLTPESGASNEPFQLNDDNVRRRHTFEHMDGADAKGSRVEESNSLATRGKLQSQVAGSPFWDVSERNHSSFSQQSRPRFHSRPVREISPDKSMARRRSTFHGREKNGGDEQWGYWGSRNRFPPSYHDTDGRTYTRPRSIIAENADKFGGINSQDRRESPNFSSKGAHWIPGKRSPYERDDYYSAHRRMPAARDTLSTTRTRGNSSGNYPKGVRNRFPNNYHDTDSHTYTRPRSIIAEKADKFGGFNSQDHRESPNHSSKGAHRIPGKRSSYERDDDYSVQRRMPAARDIVSTTRTRGSSSGNYPKGVGRGFREEYRDSLAESRNLPSSRVTHYLYRRERSFSPSSGRVVQTSLPRRKSRSRSRTRSPNVWHSQRERNQGLRRHSRSPDFRSEDRLERAGMPLQKPSFTADYSRSVASPPRGRFSPLRNGRWVDDHEHMENFPRTRRSPARIFRRAQRFDSVDSSGRLKSDEYSKPTLGPGRFPPFAGSGRGCKFEDNIDGRRNDDRVEIIHPARHSDANVTVPRLRHDAEDNFDANNSNKEDDARSTDQRNVPTISPEDKLSFKV